MPIEFGKFLLIKQFVRHAFVQSITNLFPLQPICLPFMLFVQPFTPFVSLYENLQQGLLAACFENIPKQPLEGLGLQLLWALYFNEILVCIGFLCRKLSGNPLCVKVCCLLLCDLGCLLSILGILWANLLRLAMLITVVNDKMQINMLGLSRALYAGQLCRSRQRQ